MGARRPCPSSPRGAKAVGRRTNQPAEGHLAVWTAVAGHEAQAAAHRVTAVFDNVIRGEAAKAPVAGGPRLKGFDEGRSRRCMGTRDLQIRPRPLRIEGARLHHTCCLTRDKTARRTPSRRQEGEAGERDGRQG